MFSKFIHIVACVSVLFLYMAKKIVLYGYTTFCLSIYQLMGIWDVLAIMNNSAMNVCVKVFVRIVVVVVQSFSYVWLFVTPWTAAHQASLSFIISRSLLKLMSIESMMPSNHLILLSPSPPALSLSQHQSLFQWVGSFHQVAKVLELQLQSF